MAPVLCTSELLALVLLLLLGVSLAPAALVRRDQSSAARLEYLNQPRTPALTQLRAVVMLQTVFCILAVDFPLFPRRLAKTHTWGHSLMDLGVGAVLMTGALVGRRRPPPTPGDSNSHSSSHGGGATTSPGPSRGLGHSLRRVGRRHAPLLAIGVARIIAVKASDYHEVVSEYGTHWNFFFTLALVAAAAGVATPRSAATTALCASALLLLHQAALSWGGLAEWVESAPRLGVFSANKEGLASLPGYLAIWWLGDALGETFRPRASCGDWWRALARLAAAAAALLVAAHLADAHVQRASRRLCNLAYALWVVSQVLVATCLCLASDLAPRWPPQPTPPLLGALNSHLLGLFLLANVLTGAVNLALPTMDASAPFALGVLGVYMATLCAAVMQLERALNFLERRVSHQKV